MNTSSLKWVWRGSALGVLLLGWMFILVINNFRISPPVIYVALAYFAGVGAIYALFRMGASAVGDVEPDDPDAWGLPQGAREDLEREKRTLLKAIKEAELDHQMGKLTKADLDDMVRTFRLRAIDVIKLLEDNGTGSTRDEIEREVRARIEVESLHAKVEKAHAGLTKRRNPNKAAAAAQNVARVVASAGGTAEDARAAAATAAIATDLEEDDDMADANAAKDEKSDDKSDDKAAAKAEKSDDKAAAKAEKSDADAKSDDKAAVKDEKSDDKSDDKAAAKAENSDDKSDDKAAVKAAKSDDKADAKAKADKTDDNKALADTVMQDKSDDKKADAKEATS